MKHLVLSLLIFYCFPAIASMTIWDAEKDQEITEILKYIGKVQSVANKYGIIKSSELYNKVKNIIPITLPSVQIWKIGTIARLFYYPGNAAHVGYDEVYFQTEQYCSILLSQRCDIDSKHYLSIMQSQFGQDAGGSLHYKKLVNTQNLQCR